MLFPKNVVWPLLLSAFCSVEARGALLLEITRPAVFFGGDEVPFFGRREILVGNETLGFGGQRLGASLERQIDLDQDGVDDIRFYGPSRGLAIEVFGTTEVLTSSLPPRFGDNESVVIPLRFGDILDADAPAVHGDGFIEPIWAAVENERLHGLAEGGGFEPGQRGGSFAVEGHTFVALRTLKSDGYHYSWVQIDEFGGSYGVLGGWGYETEANTPVMVGLVPEPSIKLLFVIAGVVSLRRRR